MIAGLNEIEREMEDVVSLIQRLVSIPTESPEGIYYREFIDLLEGDVKQRIPEFTTERITIPTEVYDRYPDYKAQLKGDRIILFIRSPKTGREKIHINGHYDVVKAGDPAKWTFSPAYQPKVIQGRLYGRGACDMKGSMAAFIKALEIIRREDKKLHYDLEISFTPDEEIGVYGGILYMTEQTLRGNRLIDGDFFYSLDGTQNEISIGKTGLISFEIKVKGRSVHSCRSFLGVNAILRSIPVLEALNSMKPLIEKRTSRLPVNPDLPLFHVHPNLNVTLIKGGYAAHAVPDECWIYGDRNVLPDESENPMVDARNELISCILETKQRHQLDMEFKVEEVTPAFQVSPEEEHVKRARLSATEPGEELFPVACSMGSNDISHVAHRLGICTVSRGVQREDCNVHSYNENVPLVNLKIAVRDLIRFLSD
jgi:succinyl-diaminopimelate desuccinylase